MSSIGNPEAMGNLLDRLRLLTPTTARRWGTLTPAEMLCHLGDAGDSVLGLRVAPGRPPSGKPRRILKWIFLYSVIGMPRGIKTRPGVDPRQSGTAPGDFAEDAARVASGIRAMAAAEEGALAPHHFFFGPMTRQDWHRWAWRHVDYHLRQFGL
jgi:hypothetical protein